MAFAHDCFDWREGERPTPYQDDLLGMMDTHSRTAAYGPRGLGKTSVMAWAALHFALVWDGEDWKFPITASVWRQLTHFAFPEIHKWTRHLLWSKLGRGQFKIGDELMGLSLRLKTGSVFAVAASDPQTMEGAHGRCLGYGFDEAKIIPAATFDSVEGSFTGGKDALTVKALAVSTPGEESGRFYDICSHKSGLEDWHVRHVTLDEVLAAGRVTPEWVEQRHAQWGEDSSLFRQYCQGIFASGSTDGLIRLAWVEAAIERWQVIKDREAAEGERVWGEFVCVGVDTARGGDKSVLALRFSPGIRELRYMDTRDTMQIVGAVAGVLNKYGGYAVVDIGYNPGVYDRLRELERSGSLGGHVVPFNASEHTDRKDASGELGFSNMRAAMWYGMKEILDPLYGGHVVLPSDDILTGDLVAPSQRIMSGGKILVDTQMVEEKEAIRARLHRSTDAGDAVCMAFYGEDEILEPAGGMVYAGGGDRRVEDW